MGTKWYKNIEKKTLAGQNVIEHTVQNVQFLVILTLLDLLSCLTINALSDKSMIFRISANNGVYPYSFY